MARIDVTLQKGLKAGDVPQLKAVLKDLTASEIIEAAEESEKAVYAPDGQLTLVHSPARMGVELLCRQIVNIGSINGPFDRSLLGKLSSADFAALQDKADELDVAEMKALNKRGRDDPAIGQAD